MSDWRDPWPWYVAGPIIGLFPALLLLLGNRLFGVSSNLRHLCAATGASRARYFAYDWKTAGGWNLAFAAGILLGGFIAGVVLRGPESRALVPPELFNWQALFTVKGFVLMAGGGFLIGFGTAYAGGCTSGHGLSGLADLQLPSLIAVAAFFIGGIATTFLVLPYLLQ